ncbi:DivIVA domain-containing protein [Bifidobacterium sp. ESL0775]|uniref:DivIVA domain-containing protein n=1 Tax=Bifidobacterium sp. ESL0775 TaxID=2983230 RepID=UPI0023F66EB4|nr:DivIVA domain-containing protein [Bifidobacterium sp. ESL0775]WEV69764.1 DivIVA domain-containing protein [Bifidobacterium sp. ESL0775]
MAGKSANNQSSTGIEYAGKRKWGYDVEQVDEFLDRAHEMYDKNDGSLTQQDIQSAAFTFAKGGYVIAEVDAALARLEHAVVDKNTARQIAGNGRVAWQARTQQIYKMVSDHARRAPKERFIRAEKKRPAYDMKQVDRLIDQIVTRTSDDLGVKPMSKSEARNLADLNSSSVANVIFTQRKGNRGYDERQVDYYLDACVQLLSRIESYARVGDYPETLSAEAASSAQPASVPVSPLPAQVPVASENAGAAGVSPLIDESATALFADSQKTASQPGKSEPAPSPFGTFPQTVQQDFDTSAPVSFDFNVSAENTAAPVIPDLPDSAVAASNAAATPQSPASDAAANTGADGDSSLAALASLAHASQAAPNKAETISFAPQAPVTPAPGAPSAPASSAASPSSAKDASTADQVPFASNDGNDGDNSNDMDIPSLSFPDFGTSSSDDEKTGE